MTIAEPAPADGRSPPRPPPAPPTAPARCARRAAGWRSRCGPPPTGEEVVRIRGDRDDVFSQGYICPKGSTLKQLHEDPDRLRRPLVKRDGAFVEVELGRGLRGDRAAPAADPRRARAQRLRGLRRQPERPQPRPGCSTTGPLLRALGHARTSSRPPRSTSGRRRSRSALMFGGGLNVPVPDVDRTDHLLMLGRQPLRLQRLAWPPRPTGPAASSALVERGGTLVVVDPRRSRTAEAATEWVAIRPGADAYLLMAMVQVITSRGPRRPRARCAELVTGPRRGGGGRRRRSRPRWWPHATGHRRPTTSAAWPASSPPRPRRASTGASAPPRPSSAPSPRGWSTCSTCSPATSTGPAAPCSPPRPPGASNTRGKPRFGRAVQPPPAHQPRARAARDVRRAARPWPWPRRWTRPGEGQIRALLTVAGNPVLSTPELGPARRRPRRPRVHGGRRHLRQRDHPPRRRDPAGALRAAEGPLRRRPPPARAARHRRTTASRCCPLDPDQPDEWEVLARLALVLQGAGADGRPGRRRRPDDRARWCRGAWPTRRARSTAATSRRSSTRWRPGAGPERILDFLLRTGPYGEGFGADPDGVVARQAARQPARHRPRRPQAAPARRAAHARRHDRAGARRSCWPTSSGCTTASTGAATTRSCSSAAATCARTTRGCTTSRCW